jgi:carbamoyltransferase
MKILGISAYYHDSAACIVDDGKVVAAAQEERFTREKHDQSFPLNAVRYCLSEAGVDDGKLDAVAFYDKPILKFHRILETHLSTAPRGLAPYMKSIPAFLNEKLWIPPQIEESLSECGIDDIGELYFTEHHEAHAASAFYPSPFDEAAILTIDGAGEWACATTGVGEGSDLRILKELNFPHSLGLLYSAFTSFVGFKVNSGEYKLMGLAPYGEGRYTDLIWDNLIDLKDDGSFRLNLDYFGYLDDLVMTSEKFSELFGGPPRPAESPLSRRELDIAKSIQEVTEEVVLRMGRHAQELTGKRSLCMAGGVALNCVANGRLQRAGIFDDIWVQPAATDAGGALGAALAIWHSEMGNERKPDGKRDSMNSSLLGPEFSRDQIKAYLDANDLTYTELSDEEWAPTVAALIADEKVVGLHQGRMEFGPRALGARSIVGDPRSAKMQSVLNQKIKFRESFRPFAPSCLEEKLSEYFETDAPSPYMLMVAPVRKELRKPPRGDEQEADIHEWVNFERSSLPAITHVDYSARLQSVSEETNPRYYALIKAFDDLTGCGVIINTSFNVRGEPIVCTPTDAYRCFMRTDMDYLAIGPFLLDKAEQGGWSESRSWTEVFQLD